MREASRVGGNEFSGGRESAYFLHCFRPIQWPLCSLGYDAHTTPRSEALHQSMFGFLNWEILGHDEVGGSSLVDSGPRARVRRYFDLILGQCFQVKDNCHQAKTSRGSVGLQYFGLEMCRKCGGPVGGSTPSEPTTTAGAPRMVFPRLAKTPISSILFPQLTPLANPQVAPLRRSLRLSLTRAH